MAGYCFNATSCTAPPNSVKRTSTNSFASVVTAAPAGSRARGAKSVVGVVAGAAGVMAWPTAVVVAPGVVDAPAAGAVVAEADGVVAGCAFSGLVGGGDFGEK